MQRASDRGMSVKLKSALAAAVMSNPHYTPGPWKLERFNKTNRNDGNDGWYVVSAAGDHADIGEAHLYPPHPDDIHRCRANAALMAAAPELLEALLVLMRDVEMVCADVAQELELAPAIFQANRAVKKALKFPQVLTANAPHDGPERR